ncbi:DUF6538 domain-containing protein [Luteibacter sp. ME-Dv--P-043b]|uniref:DUF6538 domain-containing protein n=1 Tax=Luteibacter sp. ME-Dv--P-043b TaxID=3040291 RepID=UPI00255600B5|nr:DUF6538 domain-containing protein [Luteibacter sp. ME-Dv--P-043b]
MRLAHHLLRHPVSGMWHFRAVVPKDLRPLFRLRVIKRSLGTRDPREARAWSYAISGRYAQMVATARARMKAGMSEQDDEWDQDYVAGIFGGDQPRPRQPPRASKWEVETPDGFRFKTDGSDRDHQHGMEALRAVLDARTHLPATAAPRHSGSRLTLADAIQAYSEVEAKAMKPNTWGQRRRALDQFAKAIGPTAWVVTITRPKASRWSDDLLRSGQSKPYVANQVSHVAQLFETLIQKGVIQDNPVKGLVVAKKAEKAARRSSGHGWEPFEEPTLKRIFDPENFKRIRKDHVRWGAIIGLYTGARVGEIAQLFLRDFVVMDGVPCVKICADSDGQSVKTGEGGERLVPLHPDLLALGVMERVERLRAYGHERFFPQMRIDSAAGKGNSISKGFNYYLGTIGVKPRRAAGIIGIHSLRKTLIQQLQGWLPLPAERRRALVGHENGDPAPDTHAGSYMRAWKPEELAAFFPGLPWANWLLLGAVRSLLA